MNEHVPIPFAVTLDNWPTRLGFAFDVKARFWRKGDLILKRIVPKHWKLYRGEADLVGRSITTLCRARDAREADLTSRLRDLMGGAVA